MRGSSLSLDPVATGRRGRRPWHLQRAKAEVELGSKRLIAGRFSSTIKFKINAIEVSRFDQ
jgi:hypothetical protein